MQLLVHRPCRARHYPAKEACCRKYARDNADKHPQFAQGLSR
jgi:hypothetical protein